MVIAVLLLAFNNLAIFKVLFDASIMYWQQRQCRQQNLRRTDRGTLFLDYFEPRVF